MSSMTAVQEKLFEDYRPLALKIASRIGNVDRDDSVQQAMYGLTRAVLGYDASKGAFPSYARQVIWTTCLDGVNDAGRRTDENAIREIAMSDRMSADDDENTIDIACEDAGFDDVETKDLLVSLLGKLDSTERELVLMRLRNRTQQECAKGLDVSQPTIHRMIVRIRSKAEEAWK